jgi:tetratricopeptide (TPR) repeat protein
MRQESVFALASLLTLSVLACPAPANSATPQGVSDSAPIVGYVREVTSSEPIPSAQIILMSPKGQASSTHITDVNGEFSLWARKGDYYVVVKKLGYQTSQVSVSVVPGVSVRLEINLPREESEPKPSSSEKVSMHQLTTPSNARHAYEKGMALRTKMDYQGALAQFEYAIKLYPSFYEAYAAMGVVQYILGDSTTAEESLHKSIDLSSHEYPEAIFYLAGIFNISKRFEDAESLARQGLALDNASWRGQLELAKALFGMKRLAEAEQCASKSRDLNPHSPPTYIMLADIHIAMRQYASALQDTDAYLKLDPNGPASKQVRATHDQLDRALQKAQPQPVRSPQ